MSIILIGVAVVPYLVMLAIPAPFSYGNSPFPVCQPIENETECVAVSSSYAFRPGDVVPMLVQRCYNEWFVTDEQIGYRVERSLVSDHDGIMIQIAPTFNQVKEGCEASILRLHAIPLETPEGAYHFEGASTIYGHFRTLTVVWRSESFKVSNRGSAN